MDNMDEERIAYIKKFEEFALEVLGKEEYAEFIGRFWQIDESDEENAELVNFVLTSIENGEAYYAIFLLNEWIKWMKDPAAQAEWSISIPEERLFFLDELYFQIKKTSFDIDLEDLFGRVENIRNRIADSVSMMGKDIKDVRNLVEPLLKVLDINPFVSNDTTQYVSIRNEMEWEMFGRLNKASCRHLRNIDSFCPIEQILYQNAFVAIETGCYSSAKKLLSEALEWNPVSVLVRQLQNLMLFDLRLWDYLFIPAVRGLKFAYRPSHFASFFRTLKLYFKAKKRDKDALCCHSLELQYGFYEKYGIAEFKLNEMTEVSLKDINESAKKHGYPITINPEILSIAEECYEKAVNADDDRLTEYYGEIISDWARIRLS